MDASCRHRRLSQLRCWHDHTASGGETPHLHVARMEGCLPLCRHPCRFSRYGGSHCQLSRMEQHRRPLGKTRAGHEETRLARNESERRQATQRCPPSPLPRHRLLPECGGLQQRDYLHPLGRWSRMVQGPLCAGRSLEQGRQDLAATRCQGHIERWHIHRRTTHRRRPSQCR